MNDRERAVAWYMGVKDDEMANVDDLATLLASVRAAERERCAKAILATITQTEREHAIDHIPGPEWALHGAKVELAAAIRAMKEPTP